MTSGPEPLWVDLDFNSPMSGSRASALLASLPLRDARVVDLGCGWGELLVRTVAAEPTASGVGVDTDVVLCIGASHAWGGASAALAALRALLRPGGRLVWGETCWSRPPTADALQALGTDPDKLGSLADLVDLAVAAGFRPLAVSEASAEEWDSFESRYALAWERYLLANPGGDDADRVRARADRHRDRWLRGYRGVLGFGYLTLAAC